MHSSHPCHRCNQWSKRKGLKSNCTNRARLFSAIHPLGSRRASARGSIWYRELLARRTIRRLKPGGCQGRRISIWIGHARPAVPDSNRILDKRGTLLLFSMDKRGTLLLFSRAAYFTENAISRSVPLFQLCQAEKALGCRHLFSSGKPTRLSSLLSLHRFTGSLAHLFTSTPDRFHLLKMRSVAGPGQARPV